MEGGLFGVYGGFGSGKTTFLTNIALEELKSGSIVFSNVKFNRNYLPNDKNYYFFNDFEQFIDVLKFAGLFAQEVSNYNLKQEENGLPFFDRHARPKFVVLFDELGIFSNSSEFKELDRKYGGELVQYILQVRKLFTTVYLAVQRPKDMYYKLREHVHYWYKYKPFVLFGRFDLGTYFGSYWLQELDKESFEVIIEKKIYTDSDGNYYHVDTPQEYKFVSIFWRPKYYKYYDDLFLNKRLQIEFGTKFLYDSNFLKNLHQDKIKNQHLLANKKLYENYFTDIDFSSKDFESSKVGFSVNPSLFLHQFSIRFKKLMTKHYNVGDFIKIKKKKSFKKTEIKKVEA